jgi:hypothetical protein
MQGGGGGRRRRRDRRQTTRVLWLQSEVIFMQQKPRMTRRRSKIQKLIMILVGDHDLMFPFLLLKASSLHQMPAEKQARVRCHRKWPRVFFLSLLVEWFVTHMA